MYKLFVAVASLALWVQVRMTLLREAKKAYIWPSSIITRPIFYPVAGFSPSLCLLATQAQLLIMPRSTTFNTVSNPNLLVCLILLIAVLVTVQDVDESIYLAIQIIGGHILLPLLVITILLKKTVNRHPVFVNFCVSWIFSSVVYSMLCVCLRFLFLSHQNSDPPTEYTRDAV